MSIPAEPGPTLADQARLRLTEISLHNFATALEMWHNNNERVYPPSLSQLVPYYLRHIPPGPHGTDQDWDYQPVNDGNEAGYELRPRGKPFAAVGLPDLCYDSRRGFVPAPVANALGLIYRLILPESQASQWSDMPHGFHYKGHSLHAYLAGPFAFGQTATEWLHHAVEEFRSRSLAAVLHKVSFEHRELSGVETRACWYGMRYHTFYATDGQAGWIFQYVAQEPAYSIEVDEMFEEMVRNRQRG